MDQTTPQSTQAAVNSATEPDKEIDTSGLKCPLPILRAKKALTDMESGQILRVISTDPASVRDFQAFARQTGNELISQSQLGQSWAHLLRRR